MNSNPTFTQEWKNLNTYQKETGNSTLNEGCWIKKDRKDQTKVWKLANEFNLNIKNGNLKYKSISEKRDFYLWFDQEIKKRGNEINWIGTANIAANQLSKFDNFFIRLFIVRNKELNQFVYNGSEVVFSFAFPQLKEVYFSNQILTGKEATIWDQNYGLKEQCEILEPLYDNLSEKALKKLERIAKGKGIYSIGISRDLRYNGKIDDCKLRYEHGLNKLLPNYLNNNNHKK